MQWQMAHEPLEHSNEITEMLQAGWEPFAVAEIRDGEDDPYTKPTIFFRRPIVVKADD